MAISKNLNFIRKSVKSFLTTIIYTVIGLIVLSILLVISIIFLPILLYRWIIIKYVAPRFRPTIGKAVTVGGHFMATEFLPVKDNSSARAPVTLPPPRCTIVCSSVIPGTVNLEEFSQAITERWLSIKVGETELKYPEFQQYLEMWNGFMFWKQDKTFSLDNHIHVHKIPENNTAEESEKILVNLIENLANKRYAPKRSPWEIHLLHNYKNPSLSKLGNQNEGGNDVMTVVIMRCHHAMVDGFSILYAIVGLLDRQLESVDVAVPRKVEVTGFASSQFRKWVYIPWRILYDTGYLMSLQWHYGGGWSTPWHAPDSRKQWKQLYDRSELIPVEKLRFIKNQFGTSFTGVLLSCLAAGAADSFKKKGFTVINKIPIGTIVPKKGHPNKLRNHTAATLLELNTSANLDPVERLKETEKDFYDARHSSQMPLIMGLVGRLLSAQLAPMARQLLQNRFTPTGLTNFPGPGQPIGFRGSNCLAMDFCVGGLRGVTGVIFTVLSYHNNIRISVTAENGVMERHELRELVITIEKELAVLYQRAMNIEQKYKKIHVNVPEEKVGDEIV